MLSLPCLLCWVLFVTQLLPRYHSVHAIAAVQDPSGFHSLSERQENGATVIFHMTIIHVNKGEGIKPVWKGNVMSCFNQIHSGELGPPNSTVSQLAATPGNYGVETRRTF